MPGAKPILFSLGFILFCSVLFVKRVLAEGGLKLNRLLSQPPECRDYRYVPLCLARPLFGQSEIPLLTLCLMAVWHSTLPIASHIRRPLPSVSGGYS